MNLKTIKEYISSLDSSSRKEPEFSGASLDILDNFAWEKCLSAYGIYSNLRSTQIKKAYKNVNKRVNALLSSDLIQETEIEDVNNKHNAKYYRLTEYGIYELFLNRLNSLLVNQSDVRKGRESPSSNALNFFRNYGNIILFEIFLYPYFKKDTLFAIGDDLLWRLYRYLSTCCASIERYLEYSKGVNIPFVDKVFSWNKIPGKDNELLLLHLKQIFNLESIEPYTIKKEDTDEEYPTITVKTSSAPIVIKLDKARNKVVMMSNANGEYKELQFDVRRLGREILVGDRIPHEESIKHIVKDAERQIEQLIYEFVYDLALSSTDSKISKEFSYYCEILSRDHKFMRAVEEIYENRHKGAQ
jgi:hypothetical protein